MVESEDKIIGTKEGIHQVFTKHYKNLFSHATPSHLSSWYWNYIHPMVSNDDNHMLGALVEVEEVRNVVYSIDTWKSPVPDGFLSGFYKKYWELLESNMWISFFNSSQELSFEWIETTHMLC